MELKKASFNQRLPLTTRFFLLSLFGLALQSCSTTSQNFPAEIALAAYGEANQNKEIAATNKTLKTDPTLQCLLGKSDFNNTTSSDDAMLRNALERARDQAIGSDDREEIAKAIQLVETGQFYRDIVSATKVSVELLPQIRNSIGPELIRPNTVLCPVSSVVSGVKGVVGNPNLSDIVDNPMALEAMLRCLYEQEGPKAVAQTAGVLLQNDSVKLAIIAYARANGVNLNESDLDTFAATALDTKDPDLEPLIEVGITRLKEEYGVDGIDTLLLEMEKNDFGCKS